MSHPPSLPLAAARFIGASVEVNAISGTYLGAAATAALIADALDLLQPEEPERREEVAALAAGFAAIARELGA